MKLVNKTKNRIIVEQIGIAITFMQKSVGLLDAKEPASLFLKTRFGIHTAGMHFAIDSAILDADFKVAVMRENIAPGKFFFWNPKYKNVIELPAGTLAHTETAIGDVLALEAGL